MVQFDLATFLFGFSPDQNNAGQDAYLSLTVQPSNEIPWENASVAF